MIGFVTRKRLVESGVLGGLVFAVLFWYFRQPHHGATVPEFGPALLMSVFGAVFVVVLDLFRPPLFGGQGNRVNRV